MSGAVRRRWRVVDREEARVAFRSVWTADEVATRVPLEVLDHLQSVTVGAKAGLDLNEKLLIAAAKIPIPDTDALRDLLETAFDASLTFDEGRSCTMLLRFLPEGASGNLSAFREPQVLNVESLRRLSPAVGTDRASSLVFTVSDHQLVIVGLDMSSKADLQKGFAVRVTGPGRVDIEWANARIVTCRPDGVRFASDNDAFTGSFAAELTGALTVSTAIPKLGVSVERIRESGHGGSIWVLPPDEAVDGDAMSIGYVMDTGGETAVDTDDDDSLLAHLHLIADVAALDGAVLIDPELRLVGFGVFMDAISGADVSVFVPGGGFRTVSDTDIGGGRHRSAAAFCRHHVGAMAVVISQDGGISVIAHLRKQNGPVLFEITDLGTRWSSGTTVS
ncbi:diadenylate cyclase [soil metagenome]